MRRPGLGFALSLGLSVWGFPADLGAEDAKDGAKTETKKGAKPKTALDFKVVGIDGEPADLRKYLNNVVLIVNVASQ